MEDSGRWIVRWREGKRKAGAFGSVMRWREGRRQRELSSQRGRTDRADRAVSFVKYWREMRIEGKTLIDTTINCNHLLVSVQLKLEQLGLKCERDLLQMFLHWGNFCDAVNLNITSSLTLRGWCMFSSLLVEEKLETLEFIKSLFLTNAHTYGHDSLTYPC